VTCPNITSLDLDFTVTAYGEQGYPWSFGFNNGDRFPDLHTLRLSAYSVLERERNDEVMLRRLRRERYSLLEREKNDEDFQRLLRISGFNLSELETSDERRRVWQSTAQTVLDMVMPGLPRPAAPQPGSYCVLRYMIAYFTDTDAQSATLRSGCE